MIDRMELPVMDSVGMPFCEVQILDVHVSLDGQQIPCSVLIEEGNLFVAVDDHQMRTGCVETEVSDGVASEWLDDPKAVHVLVHSVEVPQSHVIIQSSSCHPMPFWFDGDTGNCLVVAIECSHRFYGHSHFIPAGFLFLVILFHKLPLIPHLLILLHLHVTFFFLAALYELHPLRPYHPLINKLLYHLGIVSPAKASISPSVSIHTIHFPFFLSVPTIKQQMVSVKVTYNAKPKRTETLQVQSFADLVAQIYQIFNIQQGKINFMKPRLKDQESFAKDVKENGEILIVGTLKKEKTAEELAREKQQEIELQKMREELKMNPHEKIVKRLKEKEIKERGIEYFNTETNQPENLGIQYALCPLYLLKFAHEFKQYCVKYTCMQKNPDGLIIQQLGRMFKEMEKGEGVVCPLEWISAWICYCSDDIEYPYPTYGIDYFLNRLFSTMKMAFDVQLQKREEEPNSRVDCGTKFFGLEVLTKRTDLTKLDEQDQQVQKEIDKKVMKYFLECDLGRSEFSTLVSGIKQRFKQKNLWRNFYAFDIEYKQKIISIERLPKYLFIHCSRWGYPPAHEEWQQVQFNEGEKSYHQVRINRILDLYDLCDTNLKDKLDQGRYERDQMFYPYHMDERFPNFCQTIKHIDQLSQVEIKYHFLDHILYMKDIYHEFWFETIKNSKPTGEYRLVGVVLHRGHYYHRPNECHKHNCKGDFMTIVYKRGKEWTKYHRAEVQVVDIDEATSPEYWGKQGGWTPMLLMYKEIYMRNIQVQPPNEPRRDRTTRRR